MVHQEHLSESRGRADHPLNEPIPASAVRVIDAEAITVRGCLTVGGPEPSSAPRQRPVRPAESLDPPSGRLVGIPCVVADGPPATEPLPATAVEPFLACATPLPFVPAHPVAAAPPSRARPRPLVASQTPSQELPLERLAQAPADALPTVAPPDILHFCVPPRAPESEDPAPESAQRAPAAPTNGITLEASPWLWRLLLLAAFTIGLLLTVLLLSPSGSCR